MPTLFEIIAAPGSDLRMLERRGLTSAEWQDRNNGLGGWLNIGNRSGMRTTEAGSYAMVAPVFACVRARADALGSMPLRVGNAQDEILDAGPLVDLVEQPAPGLTTRNFWRATETHLLLFGRSHWHINALPGGQPVKIDPLHPLLMQAQRDPVTGGLAGWLYTPPGSSRQERLTTDEVHTIVDPDYENPADPFSGLSPRKAAAMAIRQYFAADVANQASLDNGVALDVILAIDPNVSLTEEQYLRVKEQFRERQSGVENRRKTFVLEGGAKVHQMSANYTDMEFSELKKMSRTDICAVFNVPPSVCGYFDDSNYAHANSAEESFWLRTILPRAAWLAEEFERAIVSRFERDRSLGMTMAQRRAMTPRDHMGRSFARSTRQSNKNQLYCWFDASGIPAVQRAMAQQADAATKWVALGVPLSDFMHAHDVGYARHPWQKTWWRDPFKIDAREDAESQLDDPAGPSADDLTLEDGPTQQGLPADGKRSLLPDTRDLSEKQKAAIWQMHRRSYLSLEKTLQSKVRGHFNELRNETLRNLEREAPQLKALGKQVIQRDVIGRILFDVFKADNTLVARVGPLIREAVRLGGNQAMQEAADATGKAQADLFRIEDPRVIEKIKARTQAMARVNHTLRRKISESLAQGVQENETTAQLADRVRKQFNFANARARTIAMTEVGAGVEEARQEGRTQAGTPMKSWLWSRKETGRHWHFDTETATTQTPVANDSPFTIAKTGSQAMGPRLSGEAKDDINCGCSTLSRYPGDSLKAVIDRYMTRGFLTYEQLLQRDAQASQTQDVKKP